MVPCRTLESDTVLPDLDAEKVDLVTVIDPDLIVDEIDMENDDLPQDIANMDRL